VRVRQGLRGHGPIDCITTAPMDLNSEPNHPVWVYNPGEAGWLLCHGATDAPTVIVAGTPERPAPELEPIGRTVLEQQEMLREKLAEALARNPVEVRGLDTSSVVVHETLPLVDLVQIEFRRPEQPHLASVFVTTGHPSPYHLYEAQVQDGVVLTLRGGYW